MTVTDVIRMIAEARFNPLGDQQLIGECGPNTIIISDNNVTVYDVDMRQIHNVVLEDIDRIYQSFSRIR